MKKGLKIIIALVSLLLLILFLPIPDFIAFKIGLDNSVMESGLGIAAIKPIQYRQYELLKTFSSTEKLIELYENHQSEAVKCYSFWALTERIDSKKLFELLKSGLSDDREVSTVFGCFIGSSKVADFLISESRGLISKADSLILDSLILFSDKKLFSKDILLMKNVGIQPFKGFDKGQIDILSKTIKEVYGFNVVVLPEKELPKSAFINIKSPRYRADSLLKYLKKTRPASVDYVIGLTNKDISTIKYDDAGKIKKPESKYKDWGVFGLGYCPGTCCVVSTFRLQKTTKENFILRYKKVCIHELGHNLGLDHCTTLHCVMSDANESIKTIDNEKLELCAKCKNQIK